VPVGSVRRKITVNVFYSTFTKVFFIVVTFLRFLTFFYFGGNVFSSMAQSTETLEATTTRTTSNSWSES